MGDGRQGHAGMLLAPRAAPRNVTAGSCRPATRTGRLFERRKCRTRPGLPRAGFSAFGMENRAPLARRAGRPRALTRAFRSSRVPPSQVPGYAEIVVSMPRRSTQRGRQKVCACSSSSDEVAIPKTRRLTRPSAITGLCGLWPVNVSLTKDSLHAASNRRRFSRKEGWIIWTSRAYSE